jgi:transcriptional regulator with XRE-family HTH domain
MVNAGGFSDIPMQICRFRTPASSAGCSNPHAFALLTQGASGARSFTMKTSSQIRACRALLGWDQRDPANAVGVDRSTIQRIERLGPKCWSPTCASNVRQAFEKGGILFIKSGIEGAGTQLTRSREFLDDLAEIENHFFKYVYQKNRKGSTREIHGGNSALL